MIAYILTAVVSVLLLAADQISKYFVASNYSLYATGTIVPGIFDFCYIHNTGGAWGMLSGNTCILIVFTAIVMILAIWWLIKKGSNNKLLFAAVCIIFAGGLGNMIDRIFRGGKVVDFIQFSFWNSFPVFNIADCAIVIGCSVLVCYLISDIINEQKAKGKSGNAE